MTLEMWVVAGYLIVAALTLVRCVDMATTPGPAKDELDEVFSKNPLPDKMLLTIFTVVIIASCALWPLVLLWGMMRKRDEGESQ